MMTSEQSTCGDAAATGESAAAAPPRPSQADLLAGAAASVAAQHARQQQRRRLGSRLLLRGRNGTASSGGGSGGGWNGPDGGGDGGWAEVQISERDARIESLEREVEASAASIKDLRSDLVRLRASFKEDEYHAAMQVEFLQEENNAFAVRVAKLEAELFGVKKSRGCSDVKNEGGGGGATMMNQEGGEEEAATPLCTEDASSSSPPGENDTITLDASYVAQLRNDVDKSKRLVALTEQVLGREREASAQAEQTLREEIVTLKTERDEQKAMVATLSDQMEALALEKKSEIEDLLARLECREETVRSISRRVVEGYERSGMGGMMQGGDAAYFEELKRDVQDLKLRFDEARLMSSLLPGEDEGEERQEERLARELY